MPEGLVEVLVGPMAGLALAVWALVRVWTELRETRASHAEERARLLTELDAEKDARLQDARETTEALLTMQERVTRLVERASSHDDDRSSTNT